MGAFLLSFAVVAVATTLVVTIALRTYVADTVPYEGGSSWPDWLAANLGFAATIAACTFGLMVIASLVRAASLGSGGGQVARQLGATQVVGEGTDPLQRRLVNVVEEMALASGVPVPEIYILEQEAGINAFASGLHHTHAAITVTRGALERLDRSELQGVIAHEFSHVLNGDMRLNQQLIGMSFGILVLSLVGRWLLRSVRFARRGRNNGGITAVLAIGFGLTIIGAIGVLLSRLIKAAVSRRRESLADASAVQFTREPEGLAGALKKIAGYTGQLSAVETEEVAHMLFARGASSFSGLFATHPPLLERIKALDPTFDAESIPAHDAGMPDSSAATDDRAGIAALAPAAMETGGALLDRAGSVGAPEVGGALRAALPEEVYSAARSRESSMLLVLAFALAPDDAARARQLSLLASRLGSVRTQLCTRLFDPLRTLDPKLRLPLLELALPAVSQRPAEQIRFLLELLERVVELDPDRRLFDFVLLRVLEAYLRRHPGAIPTAARGPSGTARGSAHTSHQRCGVRSRRRRECSRRLPSGPGGPRVEAPLRRSHVHLACSAP